MNNKNEKLIISKGDRFYKRTNAELLNCLLNKNYKAWYKSYYLLTDTSFLWMAHIDSKVRNDWKNEFVGEKLIETYVGDENNLPSNFNIAFEFKTRLVFEKLEGCFIFRGVYKLMVKESKPEVRYFEKISDTTNLFDF
ncbi:MAG: hypothetical protein IJX17_07785 [Clostridia bacterium]|nr:hypothetical protein [Clostridia bacterium]